MLFGRTPFYTENRGALFKAIIEQDVKFPTNPVISENCKSLILSLLRKVPVERLGAKNDAEEIKAHPWFTAISMEKLVKKEVSFPKLSIPSSRHPSSHSSKVKLTYRISM
jgi:serine/threonine protein kinase